MSGAPQVDASRDPRVRAIHSALQAREPIEVPHVRHDPVRWRASVALVVRPEIRELELLLIRRAIFPGDPWSGHVALPGGRRSAEDGGPAATAVRETMEEVGIDLARQGWMLGRLDDVTPRRGGPPVAVSPFVYCVRAGTEARPNEEVDSAFWVPVRALAAPGAATEHLHALASGEHRRFPAIGYQELMIWGLTHRILSQFIEITQPAVRRRPRD